MTGSAQSAAQATVAGTVPPGLIDVNAFVGPYPFRYVPHPDPEVLVRVLEREGVRGAWVGHLPSAFWRDPGPGNAALYTMLLPYADVLWPVPTIRPDWPGWERAVRQAAERGVPAVRAYPPQWGMGAHHPAMLALAQACGAHGLVLLLTVRFEDLRQRHPLDTAGDLGGAAIRALVRADPRVHVVVTAAGKELIEEVHWGLTPDEQARCWWDLSWVWGPPEDHLARMAETMGLSRFVFGAGWPLRLVQTPRATLELLPASSPRDALTAAGIIVASARAASASSGSR